MDEEMKLEEQQTEQVADVAEEKKDTKSFIEKIKEKKTVIAFSSGILLGIIIILLLLPLFSPKQLEDYTVYWQDTEQVFRDKDAKRLYPYSIGGHLYVPVSELGSFMGNMQIRSDGEIHLYSKDFSYGSLKDLYLVDYDNKGLKNTYELSKCNIVFIWASWCDDCKTQIAELEKCKEAFNVDGVQVYSLLSDSKINEKQAKTRLANCDIDYFIKLDDVVKNSLLSNATYIPKFLFVDENGNVIESVSHNMSAEELIKMCRNIVAE